MNYVEQLLFGFYPYIVTTVFFMGLWFRMAKEPHTWQASSSQVMRKRNFSWASNLFHVGVLGLAGGHVVGLLVPASAFDLLGLPVSAHQQMELIGGGSMGIAAFVGLTVLTYRRIADERVRATSDWGDLAIALLLWAALAVGLLTLPYSYQTRHEGEYLHALAHWAQHVVTFRAGAVAYLAGIPWTYKAHMLIGMTVFLVFPFTRMVHVCSAPLRYLTMRHYQIVRPPMSALPKAGQGFGERLEPSSWTADRRGAEP